MDKKLTVQSNLFTFAKIGARDKYEMNVLFGVLSTANEALRTQLSHNIELKKEGKEALAVYHHQLRVG